MYCVVQRKRREADLRAPARASEGRWETGEDGQGEPTRSWASAERSAGMLDAQKVCCYWRTPVFGSEYVV